MQEPLPSPFSSSVSPLSHTLYPQSSNSTGNFSAFGSSWISEKEHENNSGFWYKSNKYKSVNKPIEPDGANSFNNAKGKGNFYCESCDRGFNSRDKLQEHLEEHVTCGRDGCKFTAHPKIVQNHRHMQHDTGLASKILKLNSDDEIRQWREERKKNYPTAKNVEKKKKEYAEKLARGQVLNVKQFGKMRGMNRRERGRARHRGRSDWNQNPCISHNGSAISTKPNLESELPIGNPEQLPQNTIEDVPAVDFAPTAVSNKDLSSEEEGEYRSDEEIKPSIQDLPKNNVPTYDPMSSILNNTIIEAASDMETDKVHSEIPSAVGGGLGSIMCSYISDPEEEYENPPVVSKPSRPAYQPRTLRFQRRKHGSLLEKLLAKEIHRERNIIFQCVRYIVNEGYFGIDQK